MCIDKTMIMKYITLVILSLFYLNIKAQTTNAHGQYMVKTAVWKVYGGYSSFKMDLEYYPVTIQRKQRMRRYSPSV